MPNVLAVSQWTITHHLFTWHSWLDELVITSFNFLLPSLKTCSSTWSLFERLNHLLLIVLFTFSSLYLFRTLYLLFFTFSRCRCPTVTLLVAMMFSTLFYFFLKISNIKCAFFWLLLFLLLTVNYASILGYKIIFFYPFENYFYLLTMNFTCQFITHYHWGASLQLAFLSPIQENLVSPVNFAL